MNKCPSPWLVGLAVHTVVVAPHVISMLAVDALISVILNNFQRMFVRGRNLVSPVLHGDFPIEI